MQAIFKKYRVISIFLLFIVVQLALADEDRADIPSQVILDGMDASLGNEIESFVREKILELHSPGAGVGIVKGGKLIFAGYFGWADMESQKPVDSESLFRIGSISKTMTTIGLMQQWELGKFALDEDVNKYLPKSYIRPPHPKTKPVTFTHLLTHTSGGGEFLSYRQLARPWLGLFVEGDNYLPLEHYLKDGMKTKLDPGVKWAYCNYGFGYIGLALETIAGVPFHIYQKKYLFEKLGMHKTDYQHNNEIMTHLATGYRYKNNAYKEDRHKAFGVTSAGNVYSNVDEMALYIVALLNGGKNGHGAVIKPETLNMMMSTHYTLDERMSGWGLGFDIYGNDIWGRRVAGHSGSVPFGHTSHMLLVPGERAGVIVLTNSFTYSAIPLGWGILAKVLAVENTLPPIAQPRRDVWPQLVGYYGPEHRDLKTDMRLYMGGVGKYRVALIDDELVLIHTWKGGKKARPLHPVNADDPYFYWIEDDKFQLPLYVAFKKDGEGRMFLVVGGLNQYKKLGPARTIKAKLTAIPGKAINKLIP